MTINMPEVLTQCFVINIWPLEEALDIIHNLVFLRRKVYDWKVVSTVLKLPKFLASISSILMTR